MKCNLISQNSPNLILKVGNLHYLQKSHRAHMKFSFWHNSRSGPNIFPGAAVPHQLLLFLFERTTQEHLEQSDSWIIMSQKCFISHFFFYFFFPFLLFSGAPLKSRCSFLIWRFLPCGLYFIFTFSAHFLPSPSQELGSQQEPESAGMYHYILKMAYLLLLPAGSCFCPSKCSGVWKRQLHLTGWPFNSHDYLLSIHNYYRWWFPSITISYSLL